MERQVIIGLGTERRGAGALVDGRDIQESLAAWQRKIPQSIYLIDGSVRGNVAFGVDPDEIDDEAEDMLAHAADQRRGLEAATDRLANRFLLNGRLVQNLLACRP